MLKVSSNPYSIVFKGSKAKYSDGIPIRLATYEQLSAVAKDAFAESFSTDKIQIPSGKDINKCFPGAFNNRHCLTQAGIETFYSIFSKYNSKLTVDSPLKLLKQVMSDMFYSKQMPQVNDIYINLLNAIRKR